MQTINSPAKSRHLRVGGPLGVVLVVDSAPLLLRMADIARQFEGLKLLGTFREESQLVDWLVWNRAPWHVAFIDLGLPGAEDVVRRLLAQPRAGTVVAIADHLWREVRARCSALGVADLIEKGDVIAFQNYLETRIR